MKKRNELRRKYDELDEKYTRLLGEKAEYDYSLTAAKSETEQLLRQSAEIRELRENIRSLKHDMKNHLMVIASYFSSGDYDSARAYASEILDKLNKTHAYVETGNSLLNHIINEKLEFARSKGISVKAEIENLAFAKIESIDFSSVLSNLLDNAIEASEYEIRRGAEGRIYAGISKIRRYEAITVKNKISESVINSNPGLLSAKPDKANHGMGIRQIKAIAEKYGGLYDFYEDEDNFITCVMLPE